jgi:bifunctional DNA-binding transcriptional regulator/antitoxin component of YhaV-PrlF toxin-antitoxin module
VHKWTVKVTKYKGQIKVVIPVKLARLAGINRCDYVFMSFDSNGKIIMEGYSEKDS